MSDMEMFVSTTNFQPRIYLVITDCFHPGIEQPEREAKKDFTSIYCRG